MVLMRACGWNASARMALGGSFTENRMLLKKKRQNVPNNTDYKSKCIFNGF